jgi:signal transduction histidine kinase
MSTSTSARSAPSRRAWLLVLAAWMAWALLSAVELMARAMWMRGRVDFTEALAAKLPLAFTLAVVTPGIVALSRRHPLIGTATTRRYYVHAVAWLALVALIDLVSCAMNSVTTGVAFDLGGPREYAVRVLGLWLLPVGLLYWLIVLIDHGVRHFVAAREQAAASARLSAQVAQARLDALKLQLHPHFLFNALHSIGTLVRTGRSSDAIRVTAGLGDLLRRLLDDAPRQEVPLREELAFVREYLGIESIRFSDRLRVRYDIAGDVGHALVPHLLLQPLVENALRHGLHASEGGGCLTIAARRDGERLEISVADDGAGLAASDGGNGSGRRGLSTTRARLLELYGAAQSLELRARGGAGAEVRVSIPFRGAEMPQVRAAQ